MSFSGVRANLGHRVAGMHGNHGTGASGPSLLSLGRSGGAGAPRVGGDSLKHRWMTRHSGATRLGNLAGGAPMRVVGWRWAGKLR